MRSLPSQANKYVMHAFEKGTTLHLPLLSYFVYAKREYDQEIPQIKTADQPVAP